MPQRIPSFAIGGRRAAFLGAIVVVAACGRPARETPPAPVVVTPAPRDTTVRDTTVRDTTVRDTARRDSTPPARVPPAPAPVPPLAHSVVPLPASVELTAGEAFIADSTTLIVIDATAGAEVRRLARVLARMLAVDTARNVRRLRAADSVPANAIVLRLDGAASASEEGYALEATRAGVSIRARSTQGLFYGIQTLRQLFPWSVEHPAAKGRRLRVPAVRVADQPRFGWRGSMLDVSRHFLQVEDVKRHIDAMALYKLNRLHLHLSDDQGWRIEIRKHPALTRIGGSSEVGGGPGGYYTQAQFREIVRYARDHYITIVPEIDMPGHTNAALASIASLNCDRKRPPVYTGTEVGFSSLCAGRESVYRWVDDVVREIAAISPGPWFHIGGDEVEKLAHPQYIAFIERVHRIVRRHGKRVVGWGEIAPARLDTTTIVQHWRGAGKDSSALHVQRGGRVLLSPGPKTYVDMKYEQFGVLGLRWAGMIEVKDAYDWNPATYLMDVGERSIAGVEAPLWSETLVKLEDFQYMAFPRLLAIAEVGWTPQPARNWEEFRRRLGVQGSRMQALGINYYRSPQVEWGR